MLNNRGLYLETICLYLPEINTPNGNQQFIEYQNQKITDKKCIIGSTIDVDVL